MSINPRRIDGRGGRALGMALALSLSQTTACAPSPEEKVGGGRAGMDAEATADLTVGAEGPRVRAVHDFLSRFGYFENAALRKEYPGWSPIVAQPPANPSRFDARTEEGLSAYQRLNGLPVTGRLDAKTRELMARSRCAHPDVDRDAAGGRQKWAAGGAVWPSPYNITYEYNKRTFDIRGDFENARRAVTEATRTWMRVSPVFFRELSSTEPNPALRIAFFRLGERPTVGDWPSWVFDGPGPNTVGGRATMGYSTKDGEMANFMAFDDDETWSDEVPTPPGALDLEPMALHELGHVIGLDHSSVNGAIMFATVPARRTLHNDDIVAVTARYNRWEQMPAAALDIGIGLNGAVWVVGTDRRMYSWNETTNSWFPDVLGLEGAARVAVDGSGEPWVVDVNGTIHRRQGSSWQTLPGHGQDIAVWGNGVAWATSPDDTIWRWSEDEFNWVRDAHQGFARRISVMGGQPWIVDRQGRVFRRESDFWQGVATGGLDIGVGGIGLSSNWLAKTDGSLWVWNEQNSASDTPARSGFVRVAGTAHTVAVENSGRGWVVSSDGRVWRQRRD